MLKVIKDVSLEETPFIIKNQFMAPLGNSQSVISVLPKCSSGQKNEAELIDITPKPTTISLSEESSKIIDNAKKQAEQILAAANMKAEQLIKSAEIQGFNQGTENGRKQGYEEGYRQGKVQAKADIEKQLAAAIDSAHNESEQLKNNAQNEAKRIISSAETQIVQISFSIAEKILEIELEHNSDAVISIVKSAVAKVLNQDNISIKIHPQHYDTILQNKDTLQSIVGYDCNISINPDHSLGLGDCIIDTASGTVDAKMSTRLTALRTSLLDILP